MSRAQETTLFEIYKHVDCCEQYKGRVSSAVTADGKQITTCKVTGKPLRNISNDSGHQHGKLMVEGQGKALRENG